MDGNSGARSWGVKGGRGKSYQEERLQVKGVVCALVCVCVYVCVCGRQYHGACVGKNSRVYVRVQGKIVV